MTKQELEKIYQEAYRGVYWTAMSLLRNEAEAEDVVQDTFVAFIESYGDMKDTSKATALLKKIAANKSLNRLKKAKADTVDDEILENLETVPEDFLPDSLVESAEMRRIVMDIIEKTLSEDVRRTIILFYFDEMSTKEIAEALSIPQGTVLWRLNFARHKIKKEVEKYEEETKTKLFAVPFLTNLFIKEAEQVVIKPMPASLLNLLSASAEASAGEAISTAAKAVKKGTGIMIKKIIIGSIAAVIIVGAIIGVVVVRSRKAPAKNHGNNAHIADPSEHDKNDKDAAIHPGKSGSHDKDNYGTEMNGSIYVYMDDMNAKDCVENLWNTTDVFSGMTREEYCEKIIFPDDPNLHYYDKFSWSFGRNESNRFITLLEVYSKDECDPTFQCDDDESRVHLLLHLDDEAFTEELFELILERYELEGYEIKSDNGRVSGQRTVRISGNGRTFDIRAYFLTDYVIDFTIPLIGK